MRLFRLSVFINEKDRGTVVPLVNVRKELHIIIMDMKKIISVIGSTGYIGTQALSVAEKYGIRVNALAAGKNWEQLAQQCIKTGAETVCIYNEEYVKPLKDALFGHNVRVVSGMEGLC